MSIRETEPKWSASEALAVLAAQLGAAAMIHEKDAEEADSLLSTAIHLARANTFRNAANLARTMAAEEGGAR